MSMDADNITFDNPGEPSRYVFIPRPRCPECGALEIKTLRSELQEDDSVKRKSKCCECDHAFFVIIS